MFNNPCLHLHCWQRTLLKCQCFVYSTENYQLETMCYCVMYCVYFLLCLQMGSIRDYSVFKLRSWYSNIQANWLRHLQSNIQLPQVTSREVQGSSSYLKIAKDFHLGLCLMPQACCASVSLMPVRMMWFIFCASDVALALGAFSKWMNRSVSCPVLWKSFFSSDEVIHSLRPSAYLHRFCCLICQDVTQLLSRRNWHTLKVY